MRYQNNKKHKGNPVSDVNRQSNIENAAERLRESDLELKSEAVSFNDINDNIPGKTGHSQQQIKQKHRREYKFIPLTMNDSGRTHIVSDESKRLFDEDVTLDDLERMTTLFYEKAFLDPTLDSFIRSHGDPHASRFAKWIHQKLTGSTVWDDDRRQRSHRPVKLAEGIRHVVHDRSSAHAAAWYSPKRPIEDVGRHFQLDECRVWMRLHFWALRESGIMEQSPSFADYYVRFIAHFVRVYESMATYFARDSLRWSADPENINSYLTNGRHMTDVIGLDWKEAKEQIPKKEAMDKEYPYSQNP
jgi:truncated hemoglobin YjbI